MATESRPNSGAARVAAILRAQALIHRVSQSDLAEHARIDRGSVNRYLNGKRDMPMSVFLAFCERLGVDAVAVLRVAEEGLGPDPRDGDTSIVEASLLSKLIEPTGPAMTVRTYDVEPSDLATEVEDDNRAVG